ncbi:MAG: tol-pal system protein YbgF [Sulfuricella sp.]|nr:tol-pal system protein YbgF [Sulfuricella sp.]
MRRFVLLLTLFFGSASLCSASLFSDNEAHEKIASLQQKIQGMEERIAQIESMARTQSVESLTQMEGLKSDLAGLRGQIEVLSHDIDTTQKRQRDLYVDLDSRLRKLETAGAAAAEAAVQPDPAKAVSTDAAQPPAADDTQAYDAALALFKSGNYQGAIAGFQGFVNASPDSPLAASAHYWIGNSYYNLRDYKNAIASQLKVVTLHPANSKVPDALLNIASSQQGLGETAAAKKTLQSIVAKYPLSNAAGLAKKRLAK